MAIPILSNRIKKYQRFNRWAKKYIQSHASDNPHSGCSSYMTLFWAYFVKRLGLDELGYYHYTSLTPEERRHLVPRRENLKFIRSVNNVTDTSVLSDKRKCYLHFSDCYHRDVLAVTPQEVASPQMRQAFVQFVRKHGTVIIKPMSECEGKGVQAIDGNDCSDERLMAVTDDYTEGYLAEERVQQHPFMAAIHPQSVNTIRINTVRYGDTVEVLWPSWRVGQGSAVVDNYSAGGISIPIDKEKCIRFILKPVEPIVIRTGIVPNAAKVTAYNNDAPLRRVKILCAESFEISVSVSGYIDLLFSCQ